MEFGSGFIRDFNNSVQREWILTNGIGGFCSSTVIGCNTRRYHGLLVASMNPPVDRRLFLSKFDESIIKSSEKIDLYSFQANGVTGSGFKNLERVDLDLLPTFIYRYGDITVKKTIAMEYLKNTVVVQYEIASPSEDIILRITPLVNHRDYHSLRNKLSMHFYTIYDKNTILIRENENVDTRLHISCTDGELDNTAGFFEGMYYIAESERGLDCIEDHYIPGHFDIKVKVGSVKIVTLTATIEKEIPKEPHLIINKEKLRLLDIMNKAGEDIILRRLNVAADQFIVFRKSTGSKTIIAGYPWFTDWGRDTMIALNGLTLSTRRFEDAQSILETFAKYVYKGLVPNVFPDEDQSPSYNTVDASLWFFEAVYNYVQVSGNINFVSEKLLPVLKKILNHYMKGTDFNIRMCEDGLITAGNPQTQLTWMDAKVGDWVVTPRHGKAVEINALWYNALKIGSILIPENKELAEISQKVRDSFINLFWNENLNCLYDVVNEEKKDSSIRPNQILSVSLSFPVIEGAKAKKIVETVYKTLYTPVGLRTLSNKDDNYRGSYTGDQVSRDGAYHQGTVWPWIWGHFIDAWVKVHGSREYSKKKVREFIKPLVLHFEQDACIGSVSEIFEGDAPYNPKGCCAQAWSVAELLRVYKKYVIG